MFRGPLPGYYWDEEKRKYFRIQANHYAGAPPNATYTKASVDREYSETKKRKRGNRNLKYRKRHLIQRAPALIAPDIAHVGVDGELGRSTGSKVVHEKSQALARSLDLRVILDLQTAISPPRSRYIHYRPDYNVSYFDYDKDTQGLLLGLNPENNSNHDCVVSVLPEDESLERSVPGDDRDNGEDHSGSRRAQYCFSGFRPVSAFQSPLSSIHVNPATRTLVTTSTGDKQPPSVQISQLVDPIHAQRSQPLDSGMSSLFSTPNLTTIFCSAINPWTSASSTENIAIGTSGGTGVVFFTSMDTIDVGRRNWKTAPSLKTYSDVLAVDWLGPHLMTAGLRDASVVLYDIRAQQGIKRMKHSGGVLNIRRATMDTQFVAAGMGSQLALYDLRALRTTDAAQEVSKSNHGRGKPRRHHDKPKKYTPHLETESMPVAQPLLNFEYANQYDMLGLDVCSELGLVAAAETGGYLRMSSLRSGRTVKRWKLSKKEDEKIHCARFVEDERGVPRLMASCGPRLVELAW